MMVTCYILARRRNYPVQPWQGFGELVRSFGSALWAIAMTALIIGGLVTGVATPTETAVVACLYAFFVGAFVYRGLRIRDVPKIVVDSAGVSSARDPRPRRLRQRLRLDPVLRAHPAGDRRRRAVGITENRYRRHPAHQPRAALRRHVHGDDRRADHPVRAAAGLATSVGVDPIHFATFAVLNLMLGLTTPPLGVCLFVCGNIARVPLPRSSAPSRRSC
jgi:C4-dicarboxylate transporter, DctM subunit